MGRTLINGVDGILAASITRSHLNTTTSGVAVTTKILPGENIVLSQTGVDAGTGDVTVNTSDTPNFSYITTNPNSFIGFNLTQTVQGWTYQNTGTGFALRDGGVDLELWAAPSGAQGSAANAAIVASFTTGGASFSGLSASGATALSGSLTVAGASSLSSLSVSGNENVGGALSVTGAISGPGTGLTQVPAASLTGATLPASLTSSSLTYFGTNIPYLGMAASSFIGFNLSYVGGQGWTYLGNGTGYAVRSGDGLLEIWGAPSGSTGGTAAAGIVAAFSNTGFSTGTLSATGAATFDSTLSVTGLTTLASLTVTGALTIGSSLTVTGSVTANQFNGSGAGLTAIPAGQLTGTVVQANGGTGATSIASTFAVTGGVFDLAAGCVAASKLAPGAAAANLGYSPAHAGVNSDITSLNGLTTALSISQGGTGATSAVVARGNLGAAASGANADITSMSALGEITSGLLDVRSNSTNQNGFASIWAEANNYSSGPSYTGVAIRQHDNSASGTTLGLNNAGLGELYFQNTTSNLIWTNGGSEIFFGFGVNPAPSMALLSNGNFGVGNLSPSHTVDITGTFNVTGAASFGGSISGNASGLTNIPMSQAAGILAIANGGTGASTVSGARSALGAAASGSNSDITSLSGLTTALSVPQGGTGGTTAAGARSSLGAAASGANSDITSLSGLTTALSVSQGGTGATNAAGARSNLGAAASGANSDITSLSALTSLSCSGNGSFGGALSVAGNATIGGTLGLTGLATFSSSVTVAGSIGVGTSSATNQIEAVGNPGSIVARSSSTAETGSAFLGAYANDFSSKPDFTGSFLKQFDNAATGSTVGIANAGLGQIVFENVSGGMIYNNTTNPTYFGFSANSAPSVTLTYNNQVGIGMAPSYALDVAGDARVSGQFRGSGAGLTGVPAGSISGVLGAGSGGTGATSLSASFAVNSGVFSLATGAAAGNLGYAPAHAGANNDITSLSGLTTALTVAQGGTGGNTASGARASLGAAASGSNSDITSLSGLTTAISIAQGGTGSTSANSARAALGAAASGANADITSLSALATPLSISQGGTGANTAAGARSDLGAAALGANSDITSLSGLTTALSISQGGTGSTSAAGARSALGSAASGANSDITSLSGLTTALSVSQGGTGATTAAGARSDLGAAASGANSDITALSGLTTALSISQGGTGATTAQGARTGLGAAASGANSDITSLSVLVSLSASGNGTFGGSLSAAGGINASNQIVAQSNSTAETGVAYVWAQANDYATKPDYTGTAIVQYDNSATGSINGVSKAGLGMLYFQNDTAGLIYSNGQIPIYFAFGGYSAPAMTLLPNGSLGLGTTSPGKTVDVIGDVRVSGSFYGSGANLTGIPGGALASGAAATNLGFTPAHSGANSDITSLSGLTTALSVAQGGTGATSTSSARATLGAAASGANSDITSLSALTSLSCSGNGSFGGALTVTGALNASGIIEANGSGTITSAPPTEGSNTGWKVGLYGNSYAIGVAGYTTALLTGGWVSVFGSTLPANNASASAPDTNAAISFGTSGDIYATGGASFGTNIVVTGGGSFGGNITASSLLLMDGGSTGTGIVTNDGGLHVSADYVTTKEMFFSAANGYFFRTTYSGSNLATLDGSGNFSNIGTLSTTGTATLGGVQIGSGSVSNANGTGLAYVGMGVSSFVGFNLSYTAQGWTYLNSNGGFALRNGNTELEIWAAASGNAGAVAPAGVVATFTTAGASIGGNFSVSGTITGNGSGLTNLPPQAFSTATLTVTGTNTLSALPSAPTTSFVLLIVDGQTFVGAASNPAFTLSGTTVNWNASASGVTLDSTTPSVVALYI